MTRSARTRAFCVIARGSAFRFASGSHELHDVSLVLGVRYVVQGDVRVSGSGMHINVALADAVEGRELWADSFHRKLEHVFEVQEEITDLAVGALAMEVAMPEQHGRAPCRERRC